MIITNKIIIAFLSISCIPHGAMAQETYHWRASIDAGVSLTELNADVNKTQGSSYKVKTGIASGVNIEYNVFDNLVVASGIRYTQRNYKFERTRAYAFHTNYTNSFVDIPLTVGYYLFHNPYKEKGFWTKVQAGIIYEYFTRMHTKGSYADKISPDENNPTYTDWESTYDFGNNDNHLRRSLWTAEVGIQAGYSFGKIDAFAGYDYQYGMSHIYKEQWYNNSKERRNSSVIRIGAAYKF